jgi:hypothetical protein
VSIVVTDDDGLDDVKGMTVGSHIKMPTSITGVHHANTSHWFLTLFVVVQHLQEMASFKMSPESTLAYLDMLWQVVMYRDITLEKYSVYHDENPRGITTRYNKGEERLDDVLT